MLDLKSMENYFSKLPREYKSSKSIIFPLVAIGIALIGIFSVVTTLSDNLNPQKFAAGPNLGHVPSGCYYVRGNCTGPDSPGATGSCKPILVCPTATPTITPTPLPSATPAVTGVPSVTVVASTATPTPKIEIPPVNLSCETCLKQNTDSLCLHLKDKTSNCITGFDSTNSANRVCIPCKPLPPSPTPYKCIFRPTCLDANPPCTDQKPIEGWCLIGAPNVVFQQ